MAKKKSSEAEDILHIGIDLGTSRSAIASSAGKREWVHSYVGWPKDFVAQKLLGKRVLFGSEAIDNRLSLNLVRPLENGVIRDGTQRDEEAVKELVRHMIESVGARDGQKIHAAVGVPAEALKVNKLAIREAVKEYADALMVVSEPFAVAYGLDALNNAMIIDIGAGTVDFCVMHGTMPTEDDQRSLMAAGDAIDRRLLELLTDRFPEARLSRDERPRLQGKARVRRYRGRQSQDQRAPRRQGHRDRHLERDPQRRARAFLLPSSRRPSI
jgi:rod shape-determining protein MreB and related proteins